jgi:DNA-binding NtrC family response regulator
MLLSGDRRAQDLGLAASVEHIERSMLNYALKESGGRVESAARALGLSRKGLYLKRTRLGLIDRQHAGDA